MGQQSAATTRAPARPLSPAERVESAYRAEGARMWRAVYASTGSRDVADDAVAEAFAQALRRGDAVDALLPWLWRASFRIAAGLLKDRGRSVGLEDRVLLDRPAAPAAEDDVLACLEGLPLGSRRVLVLHYYVGLGAPEIADVLGTSAAAVRVRLHRARAQLRTELGGAS